MRAIIDRNYKLAQKILTENLDTLHLMAEGLIKYETIDAQQIKEIMSGKEPTPPDDWESLKIIDKDKDLQGKNGESKGSPADSIAVDDPAGEH